MLSSDWLQSPGSSRGQDWLIKLIHFILFSVKNYPLMNDDGRLIITAFFIQLLVSTRPDWSDIDTDKTRGWQWSDESIPRWHVRWQRWGEINRDTETIFSGLTPPPPPTPPGHKHSKSCSVVRSWSPPCSLTDTDTGQYLLSIIENKQEIGRRQPGIILLSQLTCWLGHL